MTRFSRSARRTAALLLLGLAAFVAVFIMPASARLFQTRTDVPSDEWTRLGPAPKEFPVRFSLALKQRNIEQLEERFYAVHDPASEHFGKHMKIEDILDVIAPEQEVVDGVIAWLKEHGIEEDAIKNLRDGLHVNATVEVAERLFKTDLHVFQHDNGGVTISSLGESHLPDHLFEHIELIVGLLDFPIPAKKSGVFRDPSDSDQIVISTPAPFGTQAEQQSYVYSVVTSLYWYNSYGIPDRRSWTNITTTTTGVTSTQGAISFLSDSFSPTDLALAGVLTGFAQTHVAARIAGTNFPNTPGGEGSMDIQAQLQANPAAPHTFWVSGSNYWVYAWALEFFNNATVPYSVSISWGSDENNSGCDVACAANGVTAATYVARSNTELMKIGLRGVTVLVSSGDDGANSAWNPNCNYNGAIKLRASFPASSPYVLSIGATEAPAAQYNTVPSVPFCSANNTYINSLGVAVTGFQTPMRFSCVLTGKEQAVSLTRSGYTSGGGFSRKFARPAYQNAAVTTYLNSGVTLPPSNYFTRAGRAFPDVAAYGGTQYAMVFNKRVILQGGTSLSAPIWASVISLMNEVTLKQKCVTMGFVNQFLYTMAAADPTTFTDVTTGDNRCPAGTCRAACRGFYTTAGWDPVTGLGVPNVTRILTYLDTVLANVTSQCTTATAANAGTMASTIEDAGLISGGEEESSALPRIVSHPIVAFVLVMLLSFALPAFSGF